MYHSVSTGIFTNTGHCFKLNTTLSNLPLKQSKFDLDSTFVIT